MPITFVCESCGRRYQVDDALAGKKTRCKACGHPLRIPAAGQASVALPPSTAPAPEPARGEARRPRRWPLLVVSGAGVSAVVGLLLWYLASPPGDEAKVADRAKAPPAAPRAPGPPEPGPAQAKLAGTSPSDVPAPKPAAISPGAERVGELRTLEGHTGTVSVIVFSPDGRRALSGGTDGTARLWDVATGRELKRLRGPAGNVVGVAFSPDGRRAIAGYPDRTLRLWDLATGQELKTLQGHAEPANRVAFSPDGRHAASVSWDRTVRLWDLDAGTELRRFDGHTNAVYGVAFSPDGRRLASGSWDRTARLWDVAAGRELKRFEGHTAEVGDVAFSRDGRLVLTGSNDGTLRLWNVESGQEAARMDTGANTGWAVALSADGRRALASHDRDVTLWDIPAGKEVRRFQGHTEQVTGVSFAPDGRTALSSSTDHMIRLWGLPPAGSGPLAATSPPPAPASPTPPADLLAKAAEARRKLDSDPNGENAGTLQPAFNEALRAAAPALTEVPVGTPEQPAEQFTRVVLNSRRLGLDGIRFKAPASGPRRDMQWEFIMPAVDNERGREMTAWYILPLSGDMIGFSGYGMGRERPIPGVDLARKYDVVQWLGNAQIRPGNEYLIWFSFEPASPPVPTYVKINLIAPQPDVRAMLQASEAALGRTLTIEEPACGLGVSPDGRRALIAAGSSVFSGDLETGQVEKRWDGPAGQVSCAAFSPDGKLAAVGCGDGKILLIDVDAGKELRALEGHSGRLRCLAFLPNGKQVVSGSEDRTARLWDVGTGKEVRKFEGHTDQVLCLAVSPDGRRLATGPSVEDKVARVWDLAKGKLVARLEGNAEAVYAIAFSTDGKSIATGGEDRSLRLYDAASGKPVRRFKPDSGGTPHAMAFLPDGHRVVVGGDGAYLTFWSATAGRYLGAYEGPFSSTQLLVPAPGGRLLTACDDRTVRLWMLPTAEAMPDVALPSRADLTYLLKAADGLEARTPEDLAELTDLDLGGRVDDAGLAHVARLVDLKTLSLPGATRLRGTGLVHLKRLTHLRSLDLTRTSVGDAGLAHLTPLFRLEVLHLGNTKVTSAGATQLKALSNLKLLDLQNDAVASDALQALCELPYLETLNLAGTRVDDQGLPLVRKLERLQTLILHGSRVTGAGVAELKKAMPHLRIED